MDEPQDALGALVAAAFEPALVLDGEGRILRENAAARGLAPRPGLRLRDLVRADEADAADALLVRALATPEPQRGRLRLVVGGARSAEHEVALQRVGGLVVCFVRDAGGALRAHAEVVAARARAAESDKLAALGTLVAGVAHEIRTPLAFIQNNLFLLERRIARAHAQGRPPEDTEAFLHASEEGIERILAIVDTLKRYTQLRSDDRRPMGLDEAVGPAVELFRVTHPSELVIDAKLQPTPAAEIVALQVEQVVLNLLTNAWEATQGKGTIRVETGESRDGRAQLVVEDDGPGIPEAARPRLYDPFFTTKQGGSGLGLSIVKRIVDDHDGDIRYEDGAHRGARFVVTFPRVHEQRP